MLRIVDNPLKEDDPSVGQRFGGRSYMEVLTNKASNWAANFKPKEKKWSLGKGDNDQQERDVDLVTGEGTSGLEAHSQ